MKNEILGNNSTAVNQMAVSPYWEAQTQNKQHSIGKITDR